MLPGDLRRSVGRGCRRSALGVAQAGAAYALAMTRPDSFTSEVLTLETEGGIATLWLDRPEKRNALGPTFWTDLPRAMDAIGADSDLRVVIIAAKGPHFSVGLDLVAMAGVLGGDGSEPGSGSSSADGDSGGQPSMAARARRARAQILRMQQSVTSVADCPLPVIAAISGYCIGGGVDLAAACDIRLASSGAVLSVREAKLAIVADLGSLQRLPSIIGRGHLAELAFTGTDITAERAAAIGLVNRVSADPEAVLKDARDLAAAIAANSPLAVQGTKAVLAAGETRSVREGLDYVAAWNAGALASDDLREAMVAFTEKRPPTFTGR